MGGWLYLILFLILLYILSRFDQEKLMQRFFNSRFGMIWNIAWVIFIFGLMLYAWGGLIYKFCMFIFDTVSNWF